MRVEIGADRLDVAPGVEAPVEVTIVNDGATTVAPSLRVAGLDGGTVHGATELPALAAGHRFTVTLALELPSDAAAGTRRVAIVAEDRDGRAGRAVGRVTVHTGSAANLSMHVSPRELRSKLSSRFRVDLHNHGSETLDVQVRGSGRRVSVRLDPDRVVLPAGHHAQIRGKVRASRPVFFGTRRTPFLVSAQGATTPASAPASLEQHTVMPRSITRLVAVVLVLALWASGVVVAIQTVRDDGSKTADSAATATDADAGGEGGGGGGAAREGASGEDAGSGAAATAAPAVVAGTIEGPQDVSGIALRIEPVSLGDVPGSGEAGKVPAQASVSRLQAEVLAAQETTTDEGGRFRFVNGITVPGVYRVTADRAGYELVSHIANLTVEKPVVELAMRMVPAQGRLGGRVVDAEGNAVGNATISVQSDLISYTTRTVSSGPGTGTWSLPGVHTPSSYVVTAAAGGFASAVTVVALDGGQTLDDIDMTLTRGLGTLRGRLLSRGEGVGGITMAIQSVDGGIERTTTSLTDIDVRGMYSVPSLPLGRYSITMSGEGWLTQTRQVEIDRGDVVLDVDDLRRSTAIIQGRVFQQASPNCEYPGPLMSRADVTAQPCGNVGITVSNEEGTWRTTSATGTGEFLVSGIPAGTFTVTFERYGYSPATIGVTVGAGDIATLGPVDSDGVTQPIVLLLPNIDVVGRSAVRGVLRDDSNPSTPLAIECLNPHVRVVEGAGSVVLDTSPTTNCGGPAATDCPVPPGLPDGTPYACILDGGGVQIERLTPGAKLIRVTLDGFDEATVIAQVPAEGMAELGIVRVLPLAGVTGLVSGANNAPVAGARVFVFPTDPADTLPPAPASPLGGWYDCTGVVGGVARQGRCVDASASGEYRFERSLASGDYTVIAPFGDVTATPAKPTPPASSLDHEQRVRQLRVTAGTSTTLDLPLRRLGAIVGVLQTPDSTGINYEFVENATVVVAAFNLPSGVTDTSRVTVGDGTNGVPLGRYRVDRMLTLDPPGRYEVTVDHALFEPQTFLVDGGVPFNTELLRNIVLVGVPARITGNVTWQSDADDPATANPVAGASVTVRGINRYNVLDVPPYREPVFATFNTTTNASGFFEAPPGAPTFVSSSVDVTVSRVGFASTTYQRPIASVDGAGNALVEAVAEPSTRALTGTIALAPLGTDPANVYDDLVVTLRSPYGGPTPSTTVSSSGAFSFAGVRPDVRSGAYEITVTGPAVKRTTPLAMTLPPSGTTPDTVPVSVPVARRWHLTGTVLSKISAGDPTSSPLAAATVTVHYEGDPGDDGDDVDVEGTTSSTGAFDILGDGPAGSYTVTVTAGGHGASTPTTQTLADGVTMALGSIELVALPASLSGTVLDGVTGTALVGGLVTVVEAGLTDTTDAAGDYEFPLLPPRTYTIEFSNNDGRSTVTRVVNLRPAENNTLDITMPGPVGSVFGTISGSQTAGGASSTLAGAQVKVQRDSGGGTWVDVAGAVTTTTGIGTFNLTNVPVGTYRLQISAVGYVTDHRPVTVVANGSYFLTATLTAATREVRVTVQSSAASTPLVGVTVNATRAGGGSASAVSGAGGVAVLTGLAPGSWTLATTGATGIDDPHADASGHPLSVGVGDPATPVAHPLPLDRYEGISVVVTGRDHAGATPAPLAGATVTASANAVTLTLDEDPDTPGTYVVRTPLAAGVTWVVTASRDGYVDNTDDVDAVADTVAGGSVLLTATSRTIEVTVRSDGSGTPLIEGVTVVATRSGGGASPVSAVTNSSGVATLSGVIAGTWALTTTGATTLAVPHADSSGTNVTVSVGSSIITRNLSLDRYEGLVVTLQGRTNPDATPAPVSGATVQATRSGTTHVLTEVVGTPGRYAYYGTLSNGNNWSTSITASGYTAPSAFNLTVATDADATASRTLDARTRTIDIDVTSSAGGALPGASITATLPGAPSVTPVTATDAADGAVDGTVRLTGLHPGTWNLSTTNGSSLSPPHANVVGEQVVIAVGPPATVLTHALGALDRHEGLDVTVTGQDHAGATPTPLTGATVSATNGTDIVSLTHTSGGHYVYRAALTDGETWSVTVTAPNYEPGATSIDAIDDADATDTVALLASGHTVEITVESDDGSPLPGAAVTATANGVTGSPVSATDADDGSTDGVVTLEDLAPASWTVGSTNGASLTPPHVDDSTVVNVTLVAADPVTATLELAPYAAVTGRTLSQFSGAGSVALVNATVTATRTGFTDVVVQSDGSGEFALDLPLDDDWALTITASGHETSSAIPVTSSSSTLGDIALERVAAAASGTVLDTSGDPASGVVVTFRPLSDPGNPGLSDTTDANGAYGPVDLDPNVTYVATFEAPGERAVTLEVAALAPGDPIDVDFVVPGDQGIRVTVMGKLSGQANGDAFALPVTADVTLHDTTTPARVEDFTEATDGSGESELDGLPTGAAYQVTVSAPGWGDASGNPTVVLSNLSVVDLAFTTATVYLYPLPRPVDVSVVDADGAAVDGATVSISGGAGFSGSATDGSGGDALDGTVSFEDVPVVESGYTGVTLYQVAVSAPGYVGGTIAGVEVPIGSASTPVAIEVRFERVELHVRQRDDLTTAFAAATATTDATITANGPGGSRSLPFTTGDTYRVEGVLDVGSWTFDVDHDTHAPTTVISDSLTAGGALSLDVLLSPPLVSVHVTSSDGGGDLAGVQVRATPSIGSVVQAVTDADGIAVLPLLPGTWTLSTQNGTALARPHDDGSVVGHDVPAPNVSAPPGVDLELDAYEVLEITALDGSTPVTAATVSATRNGAGPGPANVVLAHVGGGVYRAYVSDAHELGSGSTYDITVDATGYLQGIDQLVVAAEDATASAVVALVEDP